MQVWNVRHAARWKYRTQKIGKKIRHLGTIAQLCRALSSQLRHVSTIGKKLVKQQYLLHIPTIWRILAHKWLRSVLEFEAPQQNSMTFASCLHYCSDVAQRTSTKLCTCTAASCAGTLCIHFRGILPLREFCRWKIQFASKSCALLYWQR